MTHYLLLTILRTRYQVYRFHVPNIHFVAKDVREYNLGDISWTWPHELLSSQIRLTHFFF